MPTQDLNGKRYGKLTVLRQAATRNNRVHWTCVCDCGSVGDYAANALTRQNKSCGHCTHILPAGIKDTDIAWAAGFFDGEGSVSIQIHRGKRGGLHFSLKLTVTNTHRGSIDRMVSIFQCGTIYCSRRPGRKNVFVWSVSARHAESFLKAIRPHSTVKTDQIDLALEFRELRQSKPWVARPASHVDRGLEIAVALRGLNGYHARKNDYLQILPKTAQEIGGVG